MTVTNHPLPEASFIELAEGSGSPATIRRLGEAQHSKHLMRLHAIAAWLLGLPHLGGWVHDTLIHLDQGTAADSVTTP